MLVKGWSELREEGAGKIRDGSGLSDTCRSGRVITRTIELSPSIYERKGGDAAPSCHKSVAPNPTLGEGRIKRDVMTRETVVKRRRRKKNPYKAGESRGSILALHHIKRLLDCICPLNLITHEIINM